MTEEVRIRRQITLVMICISTLAWVLMLLGSHGGLSTHGTAIHGTMCFGNAPLAQQFSNLLAYSTGYLINYVVANSLSINALLGWLIMLVAMMLLTLVDPLQHVWERSFKRRRKRAMALFTLAYVCVWMVAGAAILSLTQLLSIMFQNSSWLILLTVLITIIWQCSPIKQQCLNRNHNHSELRAFGLAADIDALNFGLKHGLWCVLSCWALMIVPTMLAEGHMVAMVIVTFVMISESLERPTLPKWQIRIPRKLFSIVKQQGQIQFGSQQVG